MYQQGMLCFCKHNVRDQFQTARPNFQVDIEGYGKQESEALAISPEYKFYLKSTFSTGLMYTLVVL